jgi:hypothetical protein
VTFTYYGIHPLNNKCHVDFTGQSGCKATAHTKILVSLKQVQEFLQMDKRMPHYLFNLGVHILATTMLQNLRSSNQRVTKQYMDI